MPNWCVNVLTVKGDKVVEFDKDFQGMPVTWRDSTPKTTKGYCFNAQVPVPQNIIEAGYDPAGYAWQLDYWGTKWDVYNRVDMTPESYNTFKYDFETAWSPPEAWLRRVALKWFELTFTLVYFEEGMQYAGKLVYDRGVLRYSDHITGEGWNEFIVEELGFDPAYYDEEVEE